ncbi:MAG: TIGR04255 family protein [Gammaproteobacteria bacterium]|nr:TIGR04255 family protein [Gammaproteobacteria bacterium]
MKNVKLYNSPPITEAIIEITFDGELKQKDFDKVTKKLKKNYPNLQYQNTAVINLEANSIGSNLIIGNQPGIKLSTNDEADILILAQQKLAVARLAPYQGWDCLFDKMSASWKTWKTVVGIKPINRIGVRYINRIDIPIDDQGKIENQDYLNIYPHLPKSIDKLY